MCSARYLSHLAYILPSKSGEQGTFIQYSYMYLRARYGERNQGIFIEGTPRNVTDTEVQ